MPRTISYLLLIILLPVITVLGLFYFIIWNLIGSFTGLRHKKPNL